MTKDEKLERARKRIDEMFASEASAVMMIKDAALQLLVRDGRVDWASLRDRLTAMLAEAPGPSGRIRLEAAIAHLLKLAAKDG
jgi:hypothetical protein